MKFSVIMPTMWKSYRTERLLLDLCECDIIDEIIIIDNDSKNRGNISIPNKCIVLEQSENIFVNPAWNLGVSLSKNRYICIINDDISLDVDYIFNEVSSIIPINKCIGVDGESYSYNSKRIILKNGDSLGNGWGCCIFLDKNSWVDIPEDIKIWYGDNWIIKVYEKVYSIKCNIKSEVSTTVNDRNLKPRVKEDVNNWQSIRFD